MYKDDYLASLEAHIREIDIELANPPEPWKPFGTYADMIYPLVFWGDIGGVPIWERIDTEYGFRL